MRANRRMLLREPPWFPSLPPMRILSDFDGVWTDQAGEAAAIQGWYAREAGRLMGVPEEQAREEFAAFRAATLAEPHAHGWWPRGFLTAFVDEDVLLATGAVSYWLDDGGDHPAADRWRRAIADAGYADAKEFGNVQFGPAMNAHRAEGGHRLVAEARDVLGDLGTAGVDLTIVSNSPTEKLRAMFAEIGAEERDGLRFVGDARKWWIEAPEPRAEVGGRAVHLDRPIYREVLERVRPDVLIGDVASLDLAAAADLRSRGALPRDLRLLLRRNADTSPWALAQPELPRDARFVDEVVDSITAMVPR